MIDIESEQLLPIREVPNRLPRRPSGKKIHISAVYRWIQRGTRGVKLESLRIGGTSYTSIEALQRFADRISEPNVPAGIPSPSASSKRAARAKREVERILYGDARKARRAG